ncbi:MAG: hypothetical protein LRY49_10535 [Burkholderiaceae bacterium]|nr:hypothetical protein [Burkholderiaceae bacterium]
MQAVLKPWLDRPITFEELERALNAISELYQKDGWYVRPQLPAQDIVGGTVTINVIEGKLAKLTLASVKTCHCQPSASRNSLPRVRSRVIP